jgi:hypothetical protein
MIMSRWKRLLSILVPLVALIALAIGALLWASSLMDSLFAYRSPLRFTPPQPGTGSGMRTTRRLVFVLVDALREDTSLKPEVMPYLNELRRQGAWATMHSRPLSYSEPSYATLLVGAWPDLHDGPAANLEYDDIPTFTQDNLFSAAHRLGLKTAVSGYYWFEKLVPQDVVDAGYYTTGEDRLADEQVFAAALPWLDADAYQLILIHLDQVDYAGHHEGGPRDPRWDAAARRSDDLIRQIGSTLDLTQDTLLVVSDHGQIDRGGHGGDEPVTLREPFILAGAGVKPGRYSDIQMVDVAPTLAALLGTNLPAASQGRPLVEMLDQTPEQIADLQELSAAQQAGLLAAYSQAINEQIAAPTDGSVASTQRLLEDARSRRLNRERWPRILLAAFLAILPAIILIFKRSKATLWMVVSALLYVLLFNLRYVALDGLPYSLSWVGEAQEMLSYLSSTVLIAAGLSWIVFFFAMNLYRHGAGRAASLSLILTLVVIYILTLPVLYSYAANGALVTWTLPGMHSTYVAFLSLFQIAFLAVAGIALAGIAALAAGVWAAIHRSRLSIPEGVELT